MKLPRLLFAAACVFAALTTHGRVWTVDGKTQIEADFAGMAGDVVFLKKTDGERLKVSLASLAEEDRTFINEQKRGRTSVVASAPPSAASMRRQPAAPSVVADLVADKLVAPSENGFTGTYFSNPRPKYIVLYFSAGWCGPCRAFTPRLADFYRKTKPSYPDFELVFVSSDRNENAMLQYMREAQMPWPGIRFNDLKALPEIRRYGGDGIPCVAVIDREGKILAHSYVDGKYVGPAAPIQYLAKLLEAGSP